MVSTTCTKLRVPLADSGFTVYALVVFEIVSKNGETAGISVASYDDDVVIVCVNIYSVEGTANSRVFPSVVVTWDDVRFNV